MRLNECTSLDQPAPMVGGISESMVTYSHGAHSGSRRMHSSSLELEDDSALFAFVFAALCKAFSRKTFAKNRVAGYVASVSMPRSSTVLALKSPNN